MTCNFGGHLRKLRQKHRRWRSIGTGSHIHVNNRAPYRHGHQLRSPLVTNGNTDSIDDNGVAGDNGNYGSNGQSDTIVANGSSLHLKPISPFILVGDSDLLVAIK